MKPRRLFLLVLLTALRVCATQTDNHGIHAVPAPGKVAIDGRLDDWDLTGKVVMCYDLARADRDRQPRPALGRRGDDEPEAHERVEH
jgi:hypothetical protein